MKTSFDENKRNHNFASIDNKHFRVNFEVLNDGIKITEPKFACIVSQSKTTFDDIYMS